MVQLGAGPGSGEPRADAKWVSLEDGDLASWARFHDKGSTIQHWQLRDLVHVDDAGGDAAVYCASRSRVLRHDLAPGARGAAVVLDLGFEPTCLAVGSGYVAAGGQGSQLEVRRLAGGPPVFKGRAGGSVNNAVRLAPGPDASPAGEPRLLVCNNDGTVRVHALPRADALAALARAPAAVNYAALAPRSGGRLLLAVGDCRAAMLFAADSAGGFRPAGTYACAADAGMGCDWSPSGALFAAAFQDGVVGVWDVRSGRLAARLAAPLACRSVKFAPAPLDVLAFAEHRGRVHLVDCRRWDRRQVLSLGAAGGAPGYGLAGARGGGGADDGGLAAALEREGHEPDVSGVAFAPSGRRLFVGVGEGLAEFDVASAERRAFPAFDAL